MSAPFINDPEHWRRRAEEARIIAERMSDATSGCVARSRPRPAGRWPRTALDVAAGSVWES